MSLTLDPRTVEHEAATADFAKVAGLLQDHLGQQLAAYVVGLRDPKVVGKWRRPAPPPSSPPGPRTSPPHAGRRLRREHRARVAARLQQPARRRGACLAVASCRGPG